MNNIGFVYRWIDTSNDKYYIGSHKGDVNDNYIGSGFYFKRAYNNRPESFVREILYIGEDYRELEDFILEELDAKNDEKSYNLTNCSAGVRSHNESSISKMSKKLKGRIFTEEHRLKLSKKKQGKLHPQYGKKGYFTGKKHTEETKAKMSKLKSRSIYCALNDKTYNSSVEASNHLGICKYHVNNMINGYRKNKYQLFQV